MTIMLHFTPESHFYKVRSTINSGLQIVNELVGFILPTGGGVDMRLWTRVPKLLIDL